VGEEDFIEDWRGKGCMCRVWMVLELGGFGLCGALAAQRAWSAVLSA